MENIIKIYGIIWWQGSPALQNELEGESEYIKKLPTYNLLWLFNKVKMCTSGIDHTSNGYYSAVMAMRTIFWIRQGRDEHIEAYCRRFESSISTSELAKYNATTNLEINKSYADGEDEDGTNRFQEMLLIMSADSDQYSGIWNNLNNITILVTDNCKKPQLPHTTYCVVIRNRQHHAKYTRHQQ